MKNKKASKIITSVIVVLVFIFFFTAVAGFYIWIINSRGLPVIASIILAIIFAIPVIAIIAALIQRIKEIKGGEEDEASHY